MSQPVPGVRARYPPLVNDLHRGAVIGLVETHETSARQRGASDHSKNPHRSTPSETDAAAAPKTAGDCAIRRPGRLCCRNSRVTVTVSGAASPVARFATSRDVAPAARPVLCTAFDNLSRARAERRLPCSGSRAYISPGPAPATWSPTRPSRPTCSSCLTRLILREPARPRPWIGSPRRRPAAQFRKSS